MPNEQSTQPVSREVDAILKGSQYRTILRLAWPAAAAMLLETLFAVVDMIWVGQLGTVPLAAVISASFLVWILMSLTAVLTTGLVAVVSRALGAGDVERARIVTVETWRFALLFGLVLSVAALVFRDQIIGVMHLDAEVSRLAVQYMTVYLGASVIVVLFAWAGALFRACGNTRTPLWVSGIGILINMILDPLLIFGIGPFPEWGTTGAAVATVISYAVSTAIFLWLLRRQPLPFAMRFGVFGPVNLKRLGRLLLIGLPISISGISFSVIYLFINRITARFGTEAVAALGIGNRIESIDYLVSYGFALAVATLVGQNIGAGNYERAASLVHKSILMVSVLTGVMTAVYLTFPELLMRMFVDDPLVIVAGVSYVRILALSQILMGWEIVLEGAFSGAGDTKPPMIVSILGSVARIPAAWILAVEMEWGVVGIWWAITISSIVKGSVLYFWFSLGRWKNHDV